MRLRGILGFGTALVALPLALLFLPMETVVSCAVDVVNRLGELGVWDYPGLLQSLE